MLRTTDPDPVDPGSWSPTGRSAVRLLTVLTATATAALGAGLLIAAGLARWADLRAVPTQTWAPDQVIGALARLGTGLVLGWLAIGSLLALVATVPTGASAPAARLAARLAPRLLRSLVAAAVGGSLAFASAGSAVASAQPVATAQPTAAPTTRPDLTHLPEPGWTPAPPAPVPTTRPGDVALVSSAGPPPGHGPDPVVVRRGDTLWAIAARQLAPGADPAQIAREWPRWYAANREVIGPDPDLLHPGQRLTPPTSR